MLVTEGQWHIPTTPSTLRCLCRSASTQPCCALSACRSLLRIGARIIGQAGKLKGRAGAARRDAYRDEGEMQCAILPRQELERALLLLLVEGAHELQLHLAVPRNEAVVVRQNVRWDVPDWHDNLRPNRLAGARLTDSVFH